jgi:hypothetical protein
LDFLTCGGVKTSQYLVILKFGSLFRRVRSQTCRMADISRDALKAAQELDLPFLHFFSNR